MNPTGCGSLMGPYWHRHSKELPVTGARCLLGVGVGVDSWSVSPWDAYDTITPERAFGTRLPPPGPPLCAVTCMTFLDYLLPMDAWNRFENVALAPIYGDFKW